MNELNELVERLYALSNADWRQFIGLLVGAWVLVIAVYIWGWWHELHG